MIYFITNREHPVVHKSITVLNDFSLFHQFISTLKEIGFDKEFNGLNELYAIPLLTVIGNEEHQFVVDDTSFPSLFYMNDYLQKLYLGHNIKIDIKIARRQGVDIRNVYDTMIVEQRLGLDSKRPNDLAAVVYRRLNLVMPKDIREDFYTMHSKSLFEAKHILYAADDIRFLFPLKKIQRTYIEKFNYHFLIDKIENPLIPILADAELEGMNIDEIKWRKIIEDNKKKLIQKEIQLDAILNKLGLVKYQTTRQSVDVIQGSLFGDLIEEKTVKTSNKAKINYSSSKQLLQLFVKAGLTKPTETKKTKNKITGKVVYEDKDSTGEDALQAYQIEHPQHKLYEFVELLLDYKEYSKELDSFGERFINYRIKSGTGKAKLGYKNRLTNKVHTIYRQCMTTTGRLASGDAKNGFYNSQQIPAIKKYREAFTLTQEEIDNDWWITTCDLTGAEVVIMCAFAKDKNLYKWAIEEDDLHSPVATMCWKAIAEDRKKRGLKLQAKSSRGDYLDLSTEFIVDKHNNKQFRTDFKSETFGIIYGAKASTAAKTINIPKYEGQIIIDIIRNCIPDTFSMVEDAAKFAILNGYVIHNTRTNSRKWFAPILKGNPTRDQLIAIESEARNCKIQGTQADMLKEAIVIIDKYFRDKKIPNCLLLNVHDEIVWKHKGKEHGKTIGHLMGEVATKYLEGFTVMKAEATTIHNWTK